MFAFTADNHINTRGLRPNIPMEDTLSPLQFIVDYCVSHSCPLVIGGDLYDSNNPSAFLVSKVNEILSRMHQHNLPVYVIQGNHDKDRFPWACLASGVQWIHNTVIELDGFRVKGYDFYPMTSIQQLICSDQNSYDILVMHQAFRQGLSFEDAWNCDLDWLENRTRYVLAGDLHNVLDPIFSTSKNVCGWYSGSSYMTTISDNPKPSFLVVKNGPKTGDLSVQRVPIPHRRFLRFKADSVDSLERQFSSVDFTIDKPIIVVSYPVDDEKIVSFLKKYQQKAFIIEKPVVVSAFSSSQKLEPETASLLLKNDNILTLASVIDSLSLEASAKTIARQLATAATKEEVTGVIEKFRDSVFSE